MSKARDNHYWYMVPVTNKRWMVADVPVGGGCFRPPGGGESAEKDSRLEKNGGGEGGSWGRVPLAFLCGRSVCPFVKSTVMLVQGQRALFWGDVGREHPYWP